MRICLYRDRQEESQLPARRHTCAVGAVVRELSCTKRVSWVMILTVGFHTRIISVLEDSCRTTLERKTRMLFESTNFWTCIRVGSLHLGY